MGDRTTGSQQVTSFPFCGLPIVPSDANPLKNKAGEPQPQTVRVGTAGVVVFIPVGNADADTLTLTCVAGEVLLCLVRKVLASGTTAAGLTGYF